MEPMQRPPSNYAVAFIDLLAQQKLLANETIIPPDVEGQLRMQSKVAELARSLELIRQTTSSFLTGFRRPTRLRDSLDADARSQVEELRRDNLKLQFWSDGVVLYHSLADGAVKVPVQGLYCLIGLTGNLCLMGLSLGIPIRGGIDIAWGVEFYEGELHGPAVVRAYQIESRIAHYPRIVIGPFAMRFLEQHAEQPEIDISSSLNKSTSQKCLEMIATDTDGHSIVDYLGDGFEKYISKGLATNIHQDALLFITKSLDEFREKRDTKLAFRYRNLLDYFVRNGIRSQKS